MKKIVVFFFIVIALLASAYFIIPAQITVFNSIRVPVNLDGAFRNISVEKNWRKWWPEKTDTLSKSMLTLGNYQFSIQQVLYNAMAIGIQKGSVTDSSHLQFLAIGKDSVQIIWSTNISTGSNPVSRVSQYLHAVAIRKQTGVILTAMLAYLKPSQNLYGIEIKKEKVAIEFMVTTSALLEHYPTTPEIYTMVNALREYIASQHGETESFPMLNIVMLDSFHYKANVAMPIKHKIAEHKPYAVKAMFKGGNILVANISGDNKKIEAGIKSFNQYMADYQKIMMAMPFQLLLTDRTLEPDSTKWITQLYYPVN